ncbi:MAG TPA: IS1595 family transposase, partial [Noviherbaspirillum sp.]|nr:IS1595 family transposase [Noviherbaspirillum sp.]
MKTAEFQRWSAKLATLTAHQREAVEQQLRLGAPRQATERLIG